MPMGGARQAGKLLVSIAAAVHAARPRRRALDEGETSLFDGCGEGVTGHVTFRIKGHVAGGEIDNDVGDTGDLGDFIGDALDAVSAGHAVNFYGGASHEETPYRSKGQRGYAGSHPTIRV